MKKLSQIIAVLFILGYFGSPVDIVPDVPVVGHADDIGVILVMLWAGGFFSDDDEKATPTYRVLPKDD